MNRLDVQSFFAGRSETDLFLAFFARISRLDFRRLAGCMGFAATERCSQRSKRVDAWDLQLAPERSCNPVCHGAPTISGALAEFTFLRLGPRQRGHANSKDGLGIFVYI